MKLYNTMSRSVEKLKPLKQDQNIVSLYTCGLTVYSQPHIGNWVSYIYWDVLQRVLQSEGYSVNRVQNITDVGHLVGDGDAGEDKMLASALKEGTTAQQVAKKYTAVANKEAYELLGLIKPEHMPRATDYIDKQIEFVKILESKKLTYEAADGIYFNTSGLSDYGKLARLDIEGLEFGSRVESTGKKNPTDFALWKFSPKDSKRDMEWDSPWGKGFPGWHLECSVMARELLGDQIDIHAGGIDHIPVHHTNEIAQTESVTGKTFANIWIHANHIKVNGTKMSKSLGNIYTLKDITEKGFDLDAFKLMVLSKHYRTEGNFTWEILEASQNRLKKWRNIAVLRHQLSDDANYDPNSLEQGWTAVEGFNEYVLGELENDLNTPKSLSLLETLLETDMLVAELMNLLEKINEIFGIDLLKYTPDITESQKVLIKEREKARQANNWVESDEIRDKLLEQGVVLNDTADGTLWGRA